MSFPHSLRIERTYDGARADRMRNSLSPEIDPLGDPRSSATVACDGDRLVIEIGAADLVALRAATNTWFGLLRTAEATHDVAASGY